MWLITQVVNSPLQWHHDAGFLHAPSSLAVIREAWDADNSGESVGPKIALHTFSSQPQGTLDLHTIRTDWRETSIVHTALEADHALAVSESQRVATSAVFNLANILSLHAIVGTSDGTILASRRAASLRYHPGQWSLSFEEGVEADDLTFPDPLAAVALRGLKEEFGIEPSHVSHIDCLGLAIEHPIANPALLAGIRLSIPSLRAVQIATDHGSEEIEEVRTITAEQQPPPNLHPSSRLRLQLWRQAASDR
jgi:hypothetical protein